jgi:phage regulator Rha-like protein
MLLELKRPLTVQLVERLRLLRNQIDRRAKDRANATDALQDIPDQVIESSRRTLRDIKERIASLAEPSGPRIERFQTAAPRNPLSARWPSSISRRTSWSRHPYRPQPPRNARWMN